MTMSVMLEEDDDKDDDYDDNSDNGDNDDHDDDANADQENQIIVRRASKYGPFEIHQMRGRIHYCTLHSSKHPPKVFHQTLVSCHKPQLCCLSTAFPRPPFEIRPRPPYAGGQA